VNNIISRGITKFALDLDKAIYKTSGTLITNRHENVIFSPLSVSVALSLVLLGSAGKTFDEVSRILGLETGIDISQHSEIVHQMFGQLLAIMNYKIEGSNTPNVSSASGIFVQVNLIIYVICYGIIYIQLSEINKNRLNLLSKSMTKIHERICRSINNF